MILASAFFRQLQSADFQVQPIYLLYGEEPLFLRDATQLLKKRLVQQGFQNGESFDVEGSFDWFSLKMETQSVSLFADTRFITLHMPKGNPGKEGSEFFQHWSQYAQNNPDVVLVVLCERLDSRQTKSKWVKAIEARGMVVQAKPVPFKEVPGWIQQRAQSNQLTMTAEAANLLAERTEGNLLAADQELIKLSLLMGQGQTIDGHTIVENVVDQAHYQLFALSSSILEGDLQGSLHRLQRLQQEGIEPPVILWLITKELRVLIELQQLNTQMNFAQACKSLRIWSSQQGQYRQAMQRQSVTNWQACLQLSLAVDRKIKGIQPTLNASEIWLGLAEIVTRMSN